MNSTRSIVVCAMALFALTGLAHSQESKVVTPTRLNDGYGDRFLNYDPLITPGKQTDPKEKNESPPPPPPPAPTSEPQKVDVEWLRKNYIVLEDKAINDPSDVNVSAYLYARRIILDKAQRFTEGVARVINQDPLLNENNRIPYASAGAQSIRTANYNAQEKATKELAEQGGLVIFVDGNCRFCAMQLPVLQALKNNQNMEFMVVSIDGTSPKGYKGRVVKDNGLYGKLGLKLTPSIVYVSKPKAYKDGVDPNQYLVVSQGFYAQDEMMKQIAYAGHHTQLLSQETMRDLDVWNRGIVSTNDLRDLKLDVKNPESIKQTLQPLLLKQY